MELDVLNTAIVSGFFGLVGLLIGRMIPSKDKKLDLDEQAKSRVDRQVKDLMAGYQNEIKILRDQQDGDMLKYRQLAKELDDFRAKYLEIYTKNLELMTENQKLREIIQGYEDKFKRQDQKIAQLRKELDH